MIRIWILHKATQTLWVTAIIIFVSVCHPLPAKTTELATAYQRSYPKYYWANPARKERVEGLCADILRAIEKTSGITINAPQGFLPFKRLQTHLALGSIDLFIGMAKNESRLKQYIFIDTPLYEVNQIVASRKDDPAKISSLEDIRNLAPDNVILTNFGTATERFLKKQQGLNVDSEGKNLKANLNKLVHNRGRLICFHDIGLIGAIKRYGYENRIKIPPYTLHKYYHYIAFAPTTPKDIIARIERAVQELSRNGTLRKIRSRYISHEDLHPPGQKTL